MVKEEEQSIDAKVLEVDKKPLTNMDYYTSALEYEAKEVLRTTEAEDQEVFGQICSHIRTLLKDILRLKTEKPDAWMIDVDEKKKKVLMLMLSIRKLSRLQKVRVKDARDKTGESRQSVDSINLQLQNLLYEVAHLKKEVRRCLEFKSADQQIDLIPIEQFYQEAPDAISRPTETVGDPHQQRLAQLHWELEQRQDQTQLFDQLTREKDKVAATILQQETKLAAILPRINAILESTKPLQDELNLPMDAQKEQQEKSQFLPSPLYTLWVQIQAYSEACDPLVSSGICGDEEAAKKFGCIEDDGHAEASDSENEAELQEETAARKSRGKKSSSKNDYDETDESNFVQLCAMHPMHVRLTVGTKEGNKINVEFFYSTYFKIVTTKCNVKLNEKLEHSLVDVLQAHSLLCHLFPNDTGNLSPNPSTCYQLRGGLQSSHVQQVGHPFKWAQHLCGMTFVSSLEVPNPYLTASIKENVKERSGSGNTDEEEDCADGDDIKISNPPSPTASLTPQCAQETMSVSWQTCVAHIHGTMCAIRKRLQSRLALHKQLSKLDGVKSTSCIPLSKDLVQHLFSGKICSELLSWSPLTWGEYEASLTTKGFREAKLVTPMHFCFKALYERNQVSLVALIAVSPDHPYTAPLISLSVSWGQTLTAASSPHIRQLESEVNVHWTELVTSKSERQQLLPLQLYRLAIALDIFTEATSESLKQTDLSQITCVTFPKEKIFFRPARGPDRAFPFKYLPKLGVFAQR